MIFSQVFDRPDWYGRSRRFDTMPPNSFCMRARRWPDRPLQCVLRTEFPRPQPMRCRYCSTIDVSALRALVRDQPRRVSKRCEGDHIFIVAPHRGHNGPPPSVLVLPPSDKYMTLHWGFAAKRPSTDPTCDGWVSCVRLRFDILVARRGDHADSKANCESQAKECLTRGGIHRSRWRRGI